MDRKACVESGWKEEFGVNVSMYMSQGGKFSKHTHARARARARARVIKLGIVLDCGNRGIGCRIS